MELKTRGIVKGYQDGTFKPNNNISNAEALAMILRSVGKEEDKISKPTHWADGIVSAGANAGIINASSFNRNKEATRAEVAEMIVRALGLENSSVGQNIFADSSNKYANILYDQDILKGEVVNRNTYFRPNRPISRAEIGVLVTRVVEYMSSEKNNEYTDYKYFDFDANSRTIVGYNGPSDVAIPPQIRNIQVKTIGKNAFAYRKLTSVSIPDSVTSIEEKAFYSNQLTTLYIPDSVTSIGESSFEYNKLESLSIPKKLYRISPRAFNMNRLKSVSIPEGVIYIGTSAFAQNNLSSVSIPNSATKIEAAAFHDNKLTSVSIPYGTITIHSNTFSKNQLTSVIIPKGVSFIDQNAFSDNRLTSISLPTNIMRISYMAFKNNNLANVSLPKHTDVYSGAFDSTVNIIRY